jgi:hypothetical protein
MKNLIVTADWHLRDDRPRCRPKCEDWFKLQMDSLDFVYTEACEHDADVCICGDIFHYDKVSNELLNMFLSIALGQLETKTYILPGQHDLLYHSLETIDKTSYGVLEKIAGERSTPLRLMQDIGRVAPFGMNTFEGTENGLYFTHILCFNTVNSFGNWVSAKELFQNVPRADIIFAGDNHNGFEYYGENGQAVVVPGCLIRQAYDMRDYKPSVVLYSSRNDDNFEIKRIQNVVDTGELVQDSHVEKKEMKDENIGVFVEMLKGVSTKKFTLSFLDNLKEAIVGNSLNDDCIEFVQKMIGDVKK